MMLFLMMMGWCLIFVDRNLERENRHNLLRGRSASNLKRGEEKVGLVMMGEWWVKKRGVMMML